MSWSWVSPTSRTPAPAASRRRESPALDIIHLLQEKGARVFYHDPHIPSFSHDGFAMTSVKTLDLTLTEADCVVIVTNHAAYDWDTVRSKAKVIVDTHNPLRRH